MLNHKNPCKHWGYFCVCDVYSPAFLREQIAHLLEAGRTNNLEVIRQIEISSMFKGKILFLYYPGMQRIEELRDMLKRDRILEEFGVLLDMRYFTRDLDDALKRSSDIPVSVMRLDMDGFKKVNDQHGHAAGDVVMKSYLEAVRDSLGSFGNAYRGRGDEVAALIIGQEYNCVVETAEKIRASIGALRLKFNDANLSAVTASIGVATTPPAAREKGLETLADDRQTRAKKEGKDRVVYS